MADTPVWDSFSPDDNKDASASAPVWDSFGKDDINPALLPLQGQAIDPDKPGYYSIAQDWADKTKDVGFSPEFEHALGMDGNNPSVAGKVLGPLNRILTSPLLAAQYGMAGLETGADAIDAGLSDIGYRTGLNKLLGTNRINPANTALEIGNALGSETQLLNGGGPKTIANPVSDADVTGNIQKIVQEGGSADDVRNYVRSYGGNPDELKGLDEAIAAHRQGQQVGVAVEGDTAANLPAEKNQLNPVVNQPIDTVVPANPLAQEMGLDHLPNSASNAPPKVPEEPIAPVEGTPVASEPAPVTPEPEAQPSLDLGDSQPPAANAGTELPLNDKGEVVAPAETVQAQTTHTPEEIDGAVDRVTQQLDEAVKNRTEAEGLLAENRKAQAQRLQAAIEEAGENGSDTERLIKMKEALKGKTERPNIPSIREQLDPEDINRLSSRIMANPKLQAFEKFRSANAFSKLIDGEHLQPNELLLLNKTFPSNLLKGFIKNGEDLRANGLQGQGELFKQGETLSSGPIRELKPEEKPVDPDKYVFDKNQGEMFPNTRPQKPFASKKQPMAPPEKEPSVFTKALGLPRSLMATLDLSAPLRQGVFMVGRKEFYPAFASMFKQFGSKNAFKAVQDSIAASPDYQLMQKAKLALTEIDGGFTHHEEAFSTDWAGKIPVFGQLHKASERAYTGFLNKLRADSFSSIADKYRSAGIDLNDPTNAKALTDLGKYVNAATGRGNLHGKWESAAGALSTALFSPRLIASRVSLLNPKYYVDLDPITRKEAVKDLLSFGAIASTVAGLAAAGGAKVETDPRSSDFAKIRVGNTRYDMLGGFGQYLTLGARLASGQTKSSNSGEIRSLTDGKFGQPTRLDVLSNFGLNKAAPVPSFAIDYLRGKDAVGTPFDVRKEIVSRFVPLFLQDLHDVYQDQGTKGIAMGAPGIFGVGVQTYQPNQNQAPQANQSQPWDNFK